MKHLLIILLAFATSALAATRNSASLSQADVQAAVNASVDGDIVVIPSGTVTWSTHVSCNKSITIQGQGTNATTIIQNQGPGQSSPNYPDWCCVFLCYPTGSGLLRITGITMKGDGVHGGSGVVGSGKSLRIDHCWFESFYWGCYLSDYGLVDHCTFRNNFVGANIYGDGSGLSNWNAHYPIAFDSLTYMIFENCQWALDSSIWIPWGGTSTFCAAGMGSSYIVRYSDFKWSAQMAAPAFDWHGPDGAGSDGNLSAQIYSNKFTMSGSAQIDKLCDARGGQGLVYGNVLTGGNASSAYICCRNQYPSYTRELVDNFWVWNNTGGANTIQAGTGCPETASGYHNAAYSPLIAPPYPHPFIAASGGGGGGSTTPAISVNPSSYNFGVVAPGATSNFNFTVANTGGGTLIGTSSVAAPFAIVGSATYSVASNSSTTITVQFAPRTGQVGVTNRVVSFTGGGNATATVSGGTPLSGTFGASAGSITAPFTLNSDGSVSQSTETLDPTTSGSAVYSFNIANTGTYAVSINVSAPSDSGNSCFVNIDGEPISPDHIWDVAVNAAFVNTPVTWRVSGGTSPQVWTLAAGSHTLVIRGRESGLAFSQITIAPYTTVRPVAPNPPSNVHVIASN
jgi:hypothetical protein